MRLEKIGLKWKIFIYLFVFTLLLLGVLWLSQVVFLNSFYRYIRANEIEQVAQMITEQSFEDEEAFQNFLEEISDANNMHIEVISGENEIMFRSRSGSRNFFSLTQSDRELIMNEIRVSNSFRMVYSQSNFLTEPAESVEIFDMARALEHRGETIRLRGEIVSMPLEELEIHFAVEELEMDSIEEFQIHPESAESMEGFGIAQAENVAAMLLPTDASIITHGFHRGSLPNEEWLLYARAIENEESNRNIVLIRSLITPIDATVGTLQIQLQYITVFMILISVGVSTIIARRISEPIEKINATAKNLAKGNHDLDFSCVGYKEIIELSDTLNYAAVELSKVEKLRRELIANISHDLRTPLTLISGFAEMMRDLPEENTKENASIIVDETIRLTSIVNNLLEFSKLQAGAQKLELETYSLTKSLFSVVNTLNGLIRKDGYKINFMSKKDFIIESDESKIKQVFYNLLTNAVNYTGENKEIDVLMEEKESRVIVSVTDYGEGIDKDNLPYIWDRYYKIDKVHKRAITGTGIGLSIVKTILEMCPDTEYGVNSEIGVGTTFYFSFKVKD